MFRVASAHSSRRLFRSIVGEAAVSTAAAPASSKSGGTRLLSLVSSRTSTCVWSSCARRIIHQSAFIHQSATKNLRQAVRASGPASKKEGANTVARVIKYLRIPALVAGVYGVGYQVGQMDYASNPAKSEKKLLDAVVQQSGCQCDPTKPDNRTRIATDGDREALALDDLVHLRDKSDVDMHRFVKVAGRIVKVAKDYTSLARKDAESELMKELPTDITSDKDALEKVYSAQEKVDPRMGAAEWMEGDWSYVLLDSPMPNAFVTSILPRKIFLTSAMLDQYIDSDDELAIVLGHECSHLILGHNRKQGMLQAILSTIEVVLLTALNAGGLGTTVSIRLVVLLSTLKRWAGNSYSREHEREADALGIKIAAMACFDTRRGAEVFRKMQAEDMPGQSLFSFDLTHPPTDERYRYLVDKSREENAKKYESSSCGSVRSKFRHAFGHV